MAASVLLMSMCMSEKEGSLLRSMDPIFWTRPTFQATSFCTEEAPAAEVIPKDKGKLIVIVGDSVSKCS